MKQYLIDYVDLQKSTGRNALIYYEAEDVVTHQSYEELADITNSICQALSKKVINAGQVAAIIIGNHLIVPGVILGYNIFKQKNSKFFFLSIFFFFF